MGQAPSTYIAHYHLGSRLLASARSGDNDFLSSHLALAPLLLIYANYQGYGLVHTAVLEGHLHTLQLLVELIQTHAAALAAEISSRLQVQQDNKAAGVRLVGDGGNSHNRGNQAGFDNNFMRMVRWTNLQLPCPRVSKSQLLRLQNPDLVLPTLLSWQNPKGITPLMLACRAGHTDCLALLLANGADPLLLDKITRRSCLHYAAVAGHAACVNMLLNEFRLVAVPGSGVAQVLLQSAVLRDGVAGTSKFVDLRTSSGFSALHYASFWGHTAVVRALLTAGASVLCATANGGSGGTELLVDRGSNALHIAADMGHVLVAATLLKAHAETMSRNIPRPLVPSLPQQQPWEGVPRWDPRAATNSYDDTPAALAAASHRSRSRVLQGLLLLLDPSLPILWVLGLAGLGGKGQFGVPKLAVLAKAALDKHLTICLDELGNVLIKQQQEQEEAEAKGLIPAAAAAAAASVAANDMAGLASAACTITATAAASSEEAADESKVAPASYDLSISDCCSSAFPEVESSRGLSTFSSSIGSSTNSSRNSSQLSLPSCCSADWSTACSNEEEDAAATAAAASDAASSCCYDSMCGICFDAPSSAVLAGCKHKLCVGCARSIVTVTTTSRPALCPFCRLGVGGFLAAS